MCHRTGMRGASAISENQVLENAAAEASDALRGELADAKPDLVLAFVSPHHATAYGQLPDMVSSEFPDSLLLGCSADGVIGAGHEVEQRAAFSLTAASLPGVQLQPIQLGSGRLPEDPADVEGYRALLGVPAANNLYFLLLADPLSFDAAALIEALDAAYPGSRKIGGLSSGGRIEAPSALFLQSRVRRSGVVGVALSGNIAVETIVAQGCRPIGV